jgi:hypothetical protein
VSPPDLHRRPSKKLSDILAGLAEPGAGTVSLADVLAAVGERSFGALLVLFAIPNVLAGAIPGLSVVLGLPLMLLSLQLLVAAERPWLPSRLGRLQIRRAELGRLVQRIGPYLQRLERGLRPRWLVLTAPWAERIAGAACLALSLMVFLPIPFANLLPSVGIMLFGFAILERDGLVALVALGLACICVSLFGGVVAALVTAAAHALRW